jgi:hypothetical protein
VPTLAIVGLVAFTTASVGSADSRAPAGAILAGLLSRNSREHTTFNEAGTRYWIRDVRVELDGCRLTITYEESYTFDQYGHEPYWKPSEDVVLLDTVRSAPGDPAGAITVSRGRGFRGDKDFWNVKVSCGQPDCNVKKGRSSGYDAWTLTNIESAEAARSIASDLRRLARPCARR